MSTNPETHPKTPQPRRIVLCFDGTSNEFDETNTNVVRLHGMLDKRNPHKQIVYYQPGIGTFVKAGVVSRPLEWAAKKADSGFALYIDDHIIGGYKFLMNNYHEGDKICLFGFSRGAYTARALAGFVCKIGLLPRDNEEQVQFAYRLYKRKDDLCAQFKATFCTPVIIDFLGVWDTVASVGVLYNRAPPLDSADLHVRVFRHALSLDERRGRFHPSLFHHHKTPQVAAKSEGPNDATPPDVLEVWFAGCHSDVGGGAVKNKVSASLADITLRWMKKEIENSKCGIIFSPEGTPANSRIVPSVVSAFPTPQIEEKKELEVEAGVVLPALQALPSSSEESGDGEDIMARTHDYLEIKVRWCHVKFNLGWWFVEYLPMLLPRSKQKPDGTPRSKWGLSRIPIPRQNRGRARKISHEDPIFHESVRQRMNTPGLNYRPKASWKGREQYRRDAVPINTNTSADDL